MDQSLDTSSTPCELVPNIVSRGCIFLLYAARAGRWRCSVLLHSKQRPAAAAWLPQRGFLRQQLELRSEIRKASGWWRRARSFLSALLLLFPSCVSPPLLRESGLTSGTERTAVSFLSRVFTAACYPRGPAGHRLM